MSGKVTFDEVVQLRAEVERLTVEKSTEATLAMRLAHEKSGLQVEVERLEADNCRLVYQAKQQSYAQSLLCAELVRLRPVVEAARAWLSTSRKGLPRYTRDHAHACADLADALDTLDRQKQEGACS